MKSKNQNCLIKYLSVILFSNLLTKKALAKNAVLLEVCSAFFNIQFG